MRASGLPDVAPPHPAATPVGLPVVLDRQARWRQDGHVLIGGNPGRLLRLRPGSAAQLAELAGGGAAPAAVRVLARTLIDGGLAHPRPPRTCPRDVTVVVPVRDRLPELSQCLAALSRRVPVLVVDDGSRDPDGVAARCREHGASLLRLAVNAGPAAARNAAVAATATELVAFLDSDCVPPADWLADLVGHFRDPLVGAVAPRVRGAANGRRVLARYARTRGPLDLGRWEAAVRPGSPVPYVPTAALVVRRTALGGGTPFDPALRYGEDVDLVWRLHDAGWRVRYDPRTVVEHAEPQRWDTWLRRRYRYGTSAAPLARRHGSRLAPLVLPPWPTAAGALLLLGHRRVGVLAAAVPAVALYRRLRGTGLAGRDRAGIAADSAARSLLVTITGFGGSGAVVTAPVLLGLLARRRTRTAAVTALLVPPAAGWLARRPALDPARWALVWLLDDLAYAAGVWRGCWAERTAAPLRPRRSRPR